MVIRSLNYKTFKKRFKDVKDVSLDNVALPDGVTEEKFGLFLRLMDARNSEEIKDISVEDIASLFVKTEALISVLYNDSVLERPEQMRDALLRLKSRGERRRIL